MKTAIARSLTSLGFISLAIGCGGAQHTEAGAMTTGGATYAHEEYAPTPMPSNGVAYTGAPARASAPTSAPSIASSGGSIAAARDEVAAPPPTSEAAMVPSGTTITVAVTTPIPQQAVIEAPFRQPAGLLTAATVGDADRRGAFLEYLSRHPDEQETLALDMSRRIRFRVVDGQHRPVNDAEIALAGEGLDVHARTHADGGWDFYPGVSAPQSGGVIRVRVASGQAVAEQSVQLPTQGDAQDIVFQLQGAQTSPPRVLDLGFMIDVTGSMGDELRYVNREIGDIVQRVEAGAPGVHVRVGAAFYRDRVDAVPLQIIPFTENVPAFATMMQSIDASGGGDYPEDMNVGFRAAMTQLAWSQGDADRVLVLIADAPPQMYADERYTYRTAMHDAAARGIRVLPVAASGADRTVEYLFRSLGAFTSTPYAYLTDDSGIGAPHMEADTDRVAVEHFNDMLTRLVLSDLRGDGMHEPAPLGPGA